MRHQQSNDEPSLPVASPAKHAHKANTRPEEYVCDQCQASFPSVKQLNEYTKWTHMMDPADHTCLHCQQMFENNASVPCHVHNCSQWPVAMIKVRVVTHCCFLPTCPPPPLPHLMMPLLEAQCTQCTASFTSAKQLNEHVKWNHSEASICMCPHYDKVFKNVTSLPCHVKQCDQWLELQFPYVIIPPSCVPVHTFNGHAKAPVHTP